jgi:hypothetical protein
MFGDGNDLIVHDKANGKQSTANIGYSYCNKKYKDKNKASWERFHGGSTGHPNFKIIEWEVWVVEWSWVQCQE